jgi:hypothetical protein
MTAKEVYIEYNDFWNNMLNIIKSKKKFNSLNITFDNECGKINEIIHNGEFININNDINKKIEYFKKSRDYTTQLLQENKYDLIIELGSGWGRNIFYYMENNILNNYEIISGEYTDSGCAAQEYIKNKYFKNENITIYKFDFNNSKSFFDNIKKKYKNCLVLTFWAIEQVTNINTDFFENLLNISENMTCVHIEPIGWQISNKSLMKENTTGKRIYYNKNLYFILKELESKNIIKINKTILDLHNFGSTKSCGSLVEWQKNNN